MPRQMSRHCLQTSMSVLTRTGTSCDPGSEGSRQATKMADKSSGERSRIGDVKATASVNRAVRARRWSKRAERVASIRSNCARRNGTSREDGGRV